MTITIDSVIERWTGKERPLFKGSLITGEGTPDDPICYCAQGDVLHFAGWTDAKIRMLEQSKADSEVASILGISRGHSVLLRIVNDRKDGCPQDVLTNPEEVIGDQAQTVLAFYRHIDRMTEADWEKFYAARDAARDAAWAAAWAAARDAARDAAWAAARDAAWAAAWDAARDAARDAAWAAARDAAWAAAWDAARDAAWAAAANQGAIGEIMGARIMREKNQPFYFLPMFGFATPEEVVAADAAQEGEANGG